MPRGKPRIFVSAILTGRDERSRRLRRAFFVALGKTLFVFGLLSFFYVIFVVYVVKGAAVDWYVHHWTPWLRMDAFAALGLSAAAAGYFLYNYIEGLYK